MDALTQAEVFALIAELNDFIEKWDPRLVTKEREYQAKRTRIVAENNAEKTHREKAYKQECETLSRQSAKMLEDAQKILEDVDQMDQQLMSSDKYYSKTKTRKEAELAGVESQAYRNYTALMEGIEAIRRDYGQISKKYRESMLPFLINDLHFLFSAQRKKDYESLIVLRNTVHKFVNEVSELLPEITQDELAMKKEAFEQDQKTLALNFLSTIQEFDNQESIKNKSDETQLQRELDELFPQEFVDFLAQTGMDYESRRVKVNSGKNFADGILWMSFTDYPILLLVENKKLLSLLKKRCAHIMVNDVIRFPLPMACKGAEPLLVMSDARFPEKAKQLSHAWMFGVLASSPVAKLEITVIDPENRGTSVGPFFDARKRLPELFGEKICFTAEDIAAQLALLNEEIETTLMDKLGTEYDSIFDYSREHPEEVLRVRCLVMYDFPRNISDSVLADVRNILRNGSRCGIYAMVICPPPQPDTRQESYRQMLQTIQPLTAVIKQDQQSFSERGLPLLYHPMPDKAGFDRFFSKYMLIFEGMQNRGIAFSPFIRKLVEAKDDAELDGSIQNLTEWKQISQEPFDQQSASTTFPELFCMGQIAYPAEIFDESIGYKKIVRAFRAETPGHSIDMSRVELPMMFNLHHPLNLEVIGAEAQHDNMQSAAYRVIWGFLRKCPASKVRFCIFDPKEGGGSVRMLSNFVNKMPDSYKRAVTQMSRTEELLSCLKELEGQTLDFIRDRPDYDDLLDYNAHNPRRTEAITLLMLYDFPLNVDARCLELLSSVMQKGNRCGIYVVLCRNTAVEVASSYDHIDEKLAELEKNCVQIECKENGFALLPYHLSVRLIEKPDAGQLEKFAVEYHKAVEKLSVQSIHFEEILPPEPFQGSTAKVLKLPMGIGDGDSVVSMVFGEGTSHHGLIGGGTGGGKSTLLHTLIMSSMMNYSPEQLNLYLMDFKGGTEFKIYESERLPHIKLLALDALQEFGESILENLVQEMANRSDIFKRSGGYTKLEDYVTNTGNSMPRILVIMDEFQILFDSGTNRKVAERCANLAKKIVTEGRSYGVHLLMATQSTKIISTLTLDRGTIEQMRIRVGLKCGEDDTRYLFGDTHCSDAMKKMEGPRGTAVLNEDYTENNPNVGLRVAFCNDETKKYYLKQISEKFADSPCTMQVFEGSRTVPMLDYLAARSIGIADTSTVTVHMGEKIKVDDPFELTFDRKKQHNVLICGSNDELMDRTVNLFLLSAALNRRACVYCVDGDSIVGDDRCGSFYQSLEHGVAELHTAHTRSDIVQFVHDLYEKYQQRKKKTGGDTVLFVIKNLQFLDLMQTMLLGDRVDEAEYIEFLAEPKAVDVPPTVVEDPTLDLLAGFSAEPTDSPVEPTGFSTKPADDDPFAALLAQVPSLTADVAPAESQNVEERDPFADLMASFSSIGADSSHVSAQPVSGAMGNASEKLQKLIADGAAYGIHFIICSSDYQTVKESMHFGMNILNKFRERIVFALSDSDAFNLIDNVNVSTLHDNTVYYTNGATDTFQFKPYVSPAPEQVETFCSELLPM